MVLAGVCDNTEVSESGDDNTDNSDDDVSNTTTTSFSFSAKNQHYPEKNS